VHHDRPGRRLEGLGDFHSVRRVQSRAP
jgi:hypothetical protein